MKQKDTPHPFYHVIASLLWMSAIPVVVLLYIYLPQHWLEVLGLSFSVVHIWTKLLGRIRGTFVALASYTKHTKRVKHNNIVKALDVWSL